MDSELFKLILNVREIIERNKAISFVNCRIKFNQMAQSSLIPFRQSLIFTFTPQEVNKAVEFRFDKDYREIGRITLKLDPHHLTTRFEIEKWFDLENTEPGHKISAKVSLTVQKNTIETSRSRLSLKQNNFVDVKAKDGSPRLNCLSNRLSNYVKSSHMRSPHDEQHSQISAHQSVIESNQAEYMSAPHPSLSSRNRELKLNLQSVIKGMQADMLPKSQIQSTKNRDTRHDHHASKVVAPEPQTYRDREAPEKKPASRKTKSLEKPINISALELNFKLAKMGDESNIEDSKPNSTRKSNETVRGDKPIIANLKLGRLIDDSHISHIDESRPNSTRKSGEGVKDKPIDTRMIMKKHEEDKRRVKEYAERHVEEVLRDEDTKIRRENKKYQDIIIDLERAKDKHEIESRKNAEKLEFYMEKCSNLERELHFTQNQLGLWKSKAEIIKLLESELEGLRRILKERDRNMDIERAINKKRVDFEKALKDLQEENIRYREKIGTLEDELDEITKKSHALRQEKEKVTSENILLKVRIAGLEVNEEQLRHLNAQKEEIFGEIETLRSTNKQLRELIMDQKGHIWQSNDQQSHKFAETIHKLKKKVESLSSTTITCLQTVNDHLSLNKELKNSLDEFDRMYSLDGDDSDTEIIDSEESERKARNAEAEPERPRELTKHSTAESNKKPEKPVPDAKTIKRENMALGKYKSVDFNSIAAGALKIPYPTTTATLTKVRSEKSVDLTKKQPYVPIKDDAMDVKLADFINSHQEAKRLVSLIKRKSQGVYTFGSLKMCPKLENGKLFVKVGPSYLGIESFVSVHLDLEHEKLLATNIKTKKLREK